MTKVEKLTAKVNKMNELSNYSRFVFFKSKRDYILYDRKEKHAIFTLKAIETALKSI